MKLLFAISIFLLVNQAYAVETEHSPEIEKLFNEAGVNGTFVLYDVTAERFVTHNHQRAEKRFIPASTFKVANSLIGLSTGAISSVDEVLPYGGKPQPFKAWEQDMGLRDAIKVSNVPVYQELARRIGLDITAGGKGRTHALAVIDIHLTAIGLDKQLLRIAHRVTSPAMKNGAPTGGAPSH